MNGQLSKRQGDRALEELEAQFDALERTFEHDKVDSYSRKYLGDLVRYLDFIDDAPALRGAARKVMRERLSFAIRDIADFYKAIEHERDARPGATLLYNGIPQRLSNVRSAQSAAHTFHGQLLATLSNTTKKLLFESFDPVRGILRIGDAEIKTGKTSGVITNQTRLMTIIITEPFRIWAQDELLDQWEKGISPADISPHLFYDAAHKINQKVAAATGIERFIDHTTKTIAINPKYLKEN
jgi:hypothetical protein